MGKKLDKVKTATDKTVKTAGKVATIATTIVTVGSVILDAMNKGKK